MSLKPLAGSQLHVDKPKTSCVNRKTVNTSRLLNDCQTPGEMKSDMFDHPKEIAGRLPDDFMDWLVCVQC